MNRKFSQQIAGNMGYRLPTAFDQVSTKFTTIQVYIHAKFESLTSNLKLVICKRSLKIADKYVMISPNFLMLCRRGKNLRRLKAMP